MLSKRDATKSAVSNQRRVFNRAFLNFCRLRRAPIVSWSTVAVLPNATRYVQEKAYVSGVARSNAVFLQCARVVVCMLVARCDRRFDH